MWQGACMAGGCAWQEGHAWQEGQPLQQAVRVLLEFFHYLSINLSIWEKEILPA